MFQDDFASGPAEVGAYGSPDLLVNPWFWLTAFAIGLMITIFSWVGGRMRLRDQVEARRKGACEAIWKAINDRARTAASAPRHQVTAAAQALADEIRALLGPVVALAPLGNKSAALTAALEGKPAKPAAKPDGGGHPPTGAGTPKGEGSAGDGPSGPGHGGAGHGGAGPAGSDANSHPGSHIHINIGDRHYPGGTHKPEEPKPQPPREGLDIDTVRAAVMAFCDYWAHRDTIVGQLQDAQIALLRTPPGAHGHGASHGGGHGGGSGGGSGAFKHGG